MGWHNSPGNWYIGLLSGTSMDSIDAALVDFSEAMPRLLATHAEPFPKQLQQSYTHLLAEKNTDLLSIGTLDHGLAQCFAKAVNHLLKQYGTTKEKIAAIGSHGQNIFHHPHGNMPFTWQLGDPNLIASETGILTVADFRRKDIACGGQGAPLTPAFHHAFFSKPGTPRVVLNIGGIANITYLPSASEELVIGFDTGPGNTLSDEWAQQHIHRPFDRNGAWAASGEVHQGLLQLLLQDPYFQQSYPKSTGREYFNKTWLDSYLITLEKLSIATPEPTHVQATLAELTAYTIADSIKRICPVQGEIYVSGGGVHNNHLLKRLIHHCEGYTIHSTETLGVPPDWMEAMAFAWFAKNTLAGKPSNLPSVTGAKRATVLGGIYLP
ncbi:MAG: anhydro-N-acetylmuramic acid kinase [Gammaproteobacteria bacterium]